MCSLLCLLRFLFFNGYNLMNFVFLCIIFYFTLDHFLVIFVKRKFYCLKVEQNSCNWNQEIFLTVFVLSILKSVLSKKLTTLIYHVNKLLSCFLLRSKIVDSVTGFFLHFHVWFGRVTIYIAVNCSWYFFSYSFAPKLRQILFKIVAVCFALQNSHLWIIMWVLINSDCELNMHFLYLGKRGRGHWYWTSWKLVFFDFCAAHMWLVLSICYILDHYSCWICSHIFYLLVPLPMCLLLMSSYSLHSKITAL